MPKPSALPRWANLATNPAEGPQNITEPPDASKDTGWAQGKPRRDWANWLAKTVYDWFAWLQTAPPTFASEYAALDPLTGLAVGEVGVIAPADRTVSPWGILWSKTSAELGFSGLPELHCANDTHAILYRSAENKLVAVDLRDGSVAWSKSVSSVSSGKFCTDGLYVYGCNAAVIIRWTLRTGDLDTAWNSAGPGFASTLDQVVTDGVRLYGRLNNGDIQAMTIGASAASTAWTNTDTNGTTLYDIACNGLYVAWLADHGGPPATFHAALASTGAAITVTNGSGTSTMHAICSHPDGFLSAGDDDVFFTMQGGFSGSTRRILPRAFASHGRATGVSFDADGDHAALIVEGGGTSDLDIFPMPRAAVSATYSAGSYPPLLQCGLYTTSSGLNACIFGPQALLCLGAGVSDWTSASKTLVAFSRPVAPRVVRRAANTELGRGRFDRLLERLR